MSYDAKNIRNICLMGHGGSGKTSLAESMLYVTGGIDRLGKTPDGNTVCDYDPEEVKRQISISMACAPIIYKNHKLNVLDAPGNFDFAGEVCSALYAAETGIIVCSAKDGLSVGADRAWKMLRSRSMPRMIYISRCDEENSDINSTIAALKEKFGSAVTPIVLPIVGAGGVVTGFVDLLHKKAYDAKGEIAIPGDAADEVEAAYAELMEAAAGVDEELMEKYFDAGELTAEEVIRGLKAGVKDGSIAPLVCGSAVTGMGTSFLMDCIVDLTPAPVDVAPVPGVNDADEPVEIKCDPAGPTVAFVFKTVSDQYGKYSFVKILSGRLTSDMTLLNTTTGSSDKLGRLYIMKGKKNEETKELTCGDIGAIGKMDKLKTGHALCDPKFAVKPEAIPFAEPCFSKAITPKTRGQEDKVVSGLIRMNEEDPTFTIVNNAETHQVVLSGAGDIQLDVLISRLKSRFNVDAELGEARVPYREKIKKKVEAHGRHKKQTGGSGQFGDVWVRFEPQDESDELIFAEEVFGGSVPKNFFPAVEKGLRDAVNRGVLAGYPVVGLKATLYDGSYHPVDSNEMAFKTAAQLAFKEGIPNANPTILEPIGELKVTIPDSYMGDVMGDLNKRRGRVMGMNPTPDGDQILEAEVPMAEMTSYAIDLRSLTQSRGSFSFHFVRYEEAPPMAQQKAIEEAKALQEGNE
jgi:elongation factor G